MKKPFKATFVSKRIISKDVVLGRPDYYSIIKLNKTYFTLTGWMGDIKADINYVLEEITPERLEKNKYLANDFVKIVRTVDLDSKSSDT
jgi:hypothetical protein